MNWVHDRPAPRRTGRKPAIQNGGYAETLSDPVDEKTGYVKDEKTGLFLPEGARKQKRPAGFSPQS